MAGSATYSFSKDTALAHMLSSVGWPYLLHFPAILLSLSTKHTG